MIENYKPPTDLVKRIRKNAPVVTVSENDGRHGGYFGDYDDDSRGYAAVVIYIQTGLSEYNELIKETVKVVLSVQNDCGRKYPLVVAAFGKGLEFIHEGKYFELGYHAQHSANDKITEVLERLSGAELSDNPAIIPDLFPKTDNRSLYNGKIKFGLKDLMVIIGKQNAVYFPESIGNQFNKQLKDRILDVEIGENSVNWLFKDFQPKFI